MDYPEFEPVVQYAADCQEIMALYLVGSYGTKYQTPLSDLDFAVLTRNRLQFAQQAQIIADICDVIGKDAIDVVFLRRASLQLKYKVLDEGRLLYCRDAMYLSDFTEWTVKFYLDFSIDLEQFNRDYDQGLREEFLHG